jgi:hypothetical protein
LILKFWQLLLVPAVLVAGGGILVGGLAGRSIAVSVLVAAVIVWILDRPATSSE